MATTTRGNKLAQPRAKTKPAPDDSDPKGLPTSDRFAAESAHHDMDDAGHTEQGAPAAAADKPAPSSRTTATSSARAVTKPSSEAVRQEAYAIWTEEGHPHGRDQVHWHEAERRLANRDSRT